MAARGGESGAVGGLAWLGLAWEMGERLGWEMLMDAVTTLGLSIKFFSSLIGPSALPRIDPFIDPITAVRLDPAARRGPILYYIYFLLLINDELIINQIN